MNSVTISLQRDLPPFIAYLLSENFLELVDYQKYALAGAPVAIAQHLYCGAQSRGGRAWSTRVSNSRMPIFEGSSPYVLANSVSN